MVGWEVGSGTLRNTIRKSSHINWIKSHRVLPSPRRIDQGNPQHWHSQVVRMYHTLDLSNRNTFSEHYLFPGNCKRKQNSVKRNQWMCVWHRTCHHWFPQARRVQHLPKIQVWAEEFCQRTWLHLAYHLVVPHSDLQLWSLTLPQPGALGHISAKVAKLPPTQTTKDPLPSRSLGLLYYWYATENDLFRSHPVRVFPSHHFLLYRPCGVFGLHSVHPSSDRI